MRTAQRLQAPAKLNLTLEVLEPRADGYHGVRSLMVPLDLCDEFEISPAANFHFECDRPSLRDDNLALAAFDALGSRPNAAITLRKAIPVRAGLGGGSSDAAAVLLAAMSGSFGPPGDRDWLAIARSLGSDVPFFLAGSGALVEGTGERVTAVGALPDWHVLVVKPPVGVSTADAYARIDAAQRPARPRNTSVTLRALNALQRGDFDAMSHCLSNDFQDVVAAAEPAVARALAALAEAGAAAPLLAGSGACVFALTRTAAQRDEISARLQLPDEFARLATRFRQAAAWRGSVPA
ncbi:MAG TPA: 4-(cytidine 5'-diphospho)-2-C-methyl-D-erythritol kinase [Candidatus Baltobacteraceae bacterium]